MSNLIDLVALADRAAGRVSRVSLDVTTDLYGRTVPRVIAAMLDATKYYPQGALDDRIHVSTANSNDKFAYLWLTGRPGDDYESLLHELVDFLTDPPKPLRETLVVL